MKKILQFLIFAILKLLLSLRYRIRIEGEDQLARTLLKNPGGILFLPNHPTYFVDPMIVTLAVWRKFPVRPMIVEYMYFMPGIHQVMKFINALPVPNFVTSTNSIKKKKGEKVIQTVIDDLKIGSNFLIYPAGKVKLSAYESIAGASAVHRILQEAPEANVVLIRTKGLWGSRFSRAVTDAAPSVSSVLWEGIRTVFKNLIFFIPKREVILEFCPAPSDFPFNGSKIEMNKYLENWYNLPDGLMPQKGQEPGDSLVLVSYSMWKEEYLPLQHLKEAPAEEIALDRIPKAVKEKVIRKLAEAAEFDPEKIKPAMSLSSDLGLDSLDIAELVAFLNDQFEVSGVPPRELTTVGKVMSIAAQETVFEEEAEDDKGGTVAWERKGRERTRVDIAPGKTIAEVFLNQCSQMGNTPACADDRFGVQTYSQLKLRTLILADYLRKLPGTYIGILLPSSVAASMLILACQLANKVPLMVNWTVGPRHLESVVKLSDVKVIVTSWAFIDRLDNVDFNGIEDMLVMLEDIRREITLMDKIRAFIRSKRSPASLMKSLKLDSVSPEDKAVLLFTSGTESLPKGVPLSHKNILSNLRAAAKAQEIYSDDVIYGVLPPFHSFGFTVSGILGLLSGVRVAYFPDPTDGKKLAKGFQKWGATIMCGAPTFIKGMLKAANPEQMRSMRLCVSGAEKAPPELFQMLEHIGKPNCLAEGYGITECSPVLTFNPPGSPHKGVGKPLPGVELLIVNPETEVPVPIGSRGLILAKGPNIFSGYLNPGLSSPFVVVEGETWYRTGDLGNLDSDCNLTISGRMKRFVKMGGEMISLASLEDALLQMSVRKGWPTHFEGPALAVCAKEFPGEKTKIFLFSRFDISVDEVNLSLKESGFSNLVKVSTVKMLPEIPIMGTGKVNYRVLESEYVPSDSAV